MRKYFTILMVLLLLPFALLGCEVIYPGHRDRGYNSGHDGGDHDRGRGKSGNDKRHD